MVDAALRDGTAHRESLFEAFARRLPDGRRYGIVAGTGRLLELIDRFRFEDAELEWLRTNEIVRPATLDWLADYRFHGDIWGYREGEAYFPGSPLITIQATLRRGGDARDPRALDAQLRLVGRQRRGADGVGRARPAHRRDGLAPHERTRGDRRRTRGLHRGLRRDVEPRGRAHVGHPDDGHGGARVHPAARLGGGGVPRADRRVRAQDHAAHRHVRHRAGRRDGRAGGRHRPRRGAHRLGRPAHRGHVGARPARRPRRRRHEDHGHERPRRVHHRRPLGGTRRLLRRRHRRRDGIRVPGRRDGLQARRPPRRRRRVGGRREGLHAEGERRRAQERGATARLHAHRARGARLRGRWARRGGRVRGGQPVATAHGAAHGRRRRRSRVPRRRGHQGGTRAPRRGHAGAADRGVPPRARRAGHPDDVPREASTPPSSARRSPGRWGRPGTSRGRDPASTSCRTGPSPACR